MTSETYEIYRYVFLGGAILAGIMLAVSVAVFFKLKIADVIGYFTGASERKAIEQIKLNNENAENKNPGGNNAHRERGKVTDKISPSGKIIKNPSHALHNATMTEKISTQRLHPADAAPAEQVSAGNETTVLSCEEPGNETTVLSQAAPGNETTVLNAGNETTVLSAPSAAFTVEYEITYIHTNEVID